ncbi:4'-phosphopantetheinyl transferase [Caballeronia udeis]|uniref:4'-phosphopantetheinyl transferase n=1 Tax=Caballeronia udeis TaxID=1232866 RepID=A0A158GML6_9BURK|nr:4'-phosphopantetheinyl transferase superfamily protein [Caballeronia udeis]SAL32849.1 4'-phosphopantetheinyl transferase [Caballeronia udeis]
MDAPNDACELGLDIDVWLTFYDEITDEALLARLRSLLSEDERRQEARYHFADDRKRHVVTRSLVRSVLSHYADVSPADWTFSANAFGRPQIAGAQAGKEALRFNVSHTRGLIALGVTRGRELGVDVEHVSARRIGTGIAEHFFSPREAAALTQVAPERRQERFFEYWTLKESYIKARGMGMSISLDQFSFHFPHPGAVRLEMQPELGDNQARWSFWQYRPARDYLLAICAERLGGQAPRVRIHKTVPTVAVESLTLALLKSTEPIAE